MLDIEDDALTAEAVARIISITETTATGKHTDCRSSLLDRKRLAADLGRLRIAYSLQSLADNLPTKAQGARKVNGLRQAASRLQRATAEMLVDTALLQPAASAHIADLYQAAAQGDGGARHTLALLEPFVDFQEADGDDEAFTDVRVEQAVLQAHILATTLERWCRDTAESDDYSRPEDRAHQFFADQARDLFKLHFGTEAKSGLGATGQEPSPAIRFALAVFAEIKSSAEPMLSAGQLSERWRQRS